MMDDQEFEQSLREALRPVAAPDGLAERILARVAKPKATIRPWVQWGTIAAALSIGVFGVSSWQQQRLHQEVEARQAMEQFRLAMDITSRKVTGVQKKLVIEVPLPHRGGAD
ncbi:hypothetical protein [Bryobacter aggregatus]|uniref:hypothetical protein n=1 Tax=Bryobacter aggregatus TaxID=360054 RepID=UPI0004E128B7|nr:hypothetical protein [Bryobacter aggregatus]